MRSVLLLIALVTSTASAVTKPAAEILVAERGKSDFVIVRPGDAETTTRFAAEELQRYVKQMSGADLPIVTASPAGRKTIVLAVVPRPVARYALPQIWQPFDGYSVSFGAKGGKVTGQSARGVLYGVYELLERLGCRWFYPPHDPKDPEIVPARARLTVAPFTYEVVTPPAIRAFLVRDAGPEPETMALRDVDWAAKARYNAVEYDRLWFDEHRTLLKGEPSGKQAEVVQAMRARGLLSFGVSHAFRNFLPTETYFKDHPEWFGMRDGHRVPHGDGGAQFCWSNPEAVRTFVDNVAAWLATGPPLDILKLGAEDALPSCACDRCQTLNPADWFQEIANQIAARAATTNPTLLVMSPVGYPPLSAPPQSTKPHPRLHAMYEHWGRDQSISFDDSRYPAARVDPWLAATEGRTSVLLYYSGLLTSPAVPPPYTKAFAGDRAFMLRRTPEGFFAIQFPRSTWWTTGFNNYLMGRAGYDPGLAPDTVLDDYCRQYFGPAASPMLTYYRDLASDVAFSYRLTRGVRDTPAVRTADRERLRALGRLLEQAQQTASGRAPYDYRVSKAMAVHEYLESLRQSRDHRALLAMAVHARKTGGGQAPAQKDLDETIAAEETLVAGDQKRLETMPPGTYDRSMGWISGRRSAFASLKRALAGEKAESQEPADRSPEDGAKLIEQER